jgi:hypothetical protein
MKRVARRGLRLLALLALFPTFLMGLTGCSSPDAENQAHRPWGAPQSGWESGLPSSLTEGR